MSPDSTPHRIFNQRNQGARILNGAKYVEEGAWWDYRGKGPWENGFEAYIRNDYKWKE